MESSHPTTDQQSIPFRAETRQLLNILIHSLYSEREVFLRELISNAADALTRLNFHMLTDHDVLEPEKELAIWISTDPQQNIITIRDSGTGMTADEMVENLGTIAHSGARAFTEAAKTGTANIHEMIGQFGVGFYSAFMVADSIDVISRSYRLDAQAAAWTSDGTDTFTVRPAVKADRGTEVVIHLKEDAKEFAEEQRLRQIIRTHSDFIAYPIYVGDSQEQVNKQSAIWRQPPQQVKEEEYNEFYKQYTLDFESPLAHLHLNIDAPVQLYGLLYLPTSPERGIFSPRTEDGLRLYARKVLIQEYSTDLLPHALRFMQGVVDSEDIPLNVSREMVQSSRVMTQLRKVITSKVIDQLKTMGKNDPERYGKFWAAFGRFIKEGVAADEENSSALIPLLRFHSLQHPDEWISLDQYIETMSASQEKVFYLLGDDEAALAHSPHLEAFRQKNVDVLWMADPLDAFVLIRLTRYQEKELANVATEDLETEAEKPAEKEEDTQSENADLIERFKQALGDRVASVRATDRLVESPARLVDQQGSLPPEMQRVYRALNREFPAPQRVLEINPNHPILQKVNSLPAEHPLASAVIEQIYEDALLIEGLHPNPASMISRIQRLMEAALHE